MAGRGFHVEALRVPKEVSNKGCTRTKGGFMCQILCFLQIFQQLQYKQ